MKRYDLANARKMPQQPRARQLWRISLFWRTFLQIVLLMLISLAVWLETFQTLELEPLAEQTAQHISVQVGLSQSSVVFAQEPTRLALIEMLQDLHNVRVIAGSPQEQVDLGIHSLFMLRVEKILQTKFGSGTHLARAVNGEEGLWVRFEVKGHTTHYWMLVEQSEFTGISYEALAIWIGLTTLISVAGATVITRLVNRPLRDFGKAAALVQEGKLSQAHLRERVSTKEISELNHSFNSMLDKLTEVEAERALMLAGISHDLRTPLARLRLEIELSVPDDHVRMMMSEDISQVDAILNKFMDYARLGKQNIRSLELSKLVQHCCDPFAMNNDIDIRLDISPDIRVLADEVDLGRVINNLIENAQRYGRSKDTGRCEIEISASVTTDWVTLRLQDHGLGVPEAQLAQLVQPFFRGEAARTEATGAGLGLSIVDKTVRRMGGSLKLFNAHPSGLMAYIQLPLAQPGSTMTS
ncbi:HAMP domain-containing protein [Curvibacter sp. CHRR-16]|uniref:ATP-binding protein n=1 Tax=Curvibacter sp. CHRR-16 TaxID=2835872 RepID=UPI001BD975C3|nr:ATP-binding protein [Curvibacter sp. CHRR-16]MBT0569298.1 HAMP domain-containing protein [Curvibacter sp. CHRR-16]